jgi:hypothetical protein
MGDEKKAKKAKKEKKEKKEKREKKDKKVCHPTSHHSSLAFQLLSPSILSLPCMSVHPVNAHC